MFRFSLSLGAMWFIIRYSGELTIKSRQVRARFQKRLIANLSDALDSSGIQYTVHVEWDRVLLEAETLEAGQVAARVFGIHSLSVIEHECEPTLEAIVRVGKEQYADRVRGKTFAVRARRLGKHKFRSLDVNVQLGSALDETAAKVDLSHPEVTVHVDVRQDKARFHCDRIMGSEGLPLGTQSKALALISGGFDSPAAAWAMLNRGVELDYLLCNLAGAAFERSVVTVAKVLSDNWSHGVRPKLHVVDFEPMVTQLRRDVKPNYVQVILKRLMYRVGMRVAHALEAEAIVTGESVGQVSSQTLRNLRVIEEVADLPVLRPLVGMNKQEIITRTRAIGTYALSASVQEYCALVSHKPTTAARFDVARAEEARIDLDQLDELTDARKTIDLRSLDASDLALPYLFTEDVPENAVVIDCREEDQYEAWHYPNAECRPLEDLLAKFRDLDKSKVYVLYCPFGLQSSVAAEHMQTAGYQA
ncbi:MAG: tRNA 4-thiouridine(8) synthase ThiI, partial [Planctomycetales bacterium]